MTQVVFREAGSWGGQGIRLVWGWIGWGREQDVIEHGYRYQHIVRESFFGDLTQLNSQNKYQTFASPGAIRSGDNANL